MAFIEMHAAFHEQHRLSAQGAEKEFPACPGTEETGSPASAKETSRSTNTASANGPNPDPSTAPVIGGILTEKRPIPQSESGSQSRHRSTIKQLF